MEGETVVVVRLKPLSKPFRRREVSWPWILRPDSSVSTVGGRGDETIEETGRTHGIVEEGRQLGRQSVLLGDDYEDAHDLVLKVFNTCGNPRGDQRNWEHGPENNLGQVSTQDGDGLILQNEPINNLGLSSPWAGPDVFEGSFVQTLGKSSVGVDPTFNMGPIHNHFSKGPDLGRASKHASNSGHANTGASESTNEHSDGSHHQRTGFARIDLGKVAINKVVSEPRSQLNPTEIHLGLADLVDRLTGDLLQLRGCSNNDCARVDEVEIQRDVNILAKEVEEGLYNPFEVLQALDEYGSFENSEGSSVPEEGKDGMEDKAELSDPNLDWLFHENQAPDSDSKECAEGKECDGGSNSCEKFLSHVWEGRGGEGESHDATVCHLSCGGASIGEDIVSHAINNSLDTTKSLVPPAFNEEDHRTVPSEGVSPDHGLGVDSVSGTDVDESERWLRKMSKYVSFPLEEGDVPHFVHLLDTLGLSLVKNNGFKSRSKKREFVPKGGNTQKSSRHRKGWRELRNLKSDINYEGGEVNDDNFMGEKVHEEFYEIGG
ncbi:hypothetical protein LOK49_LG07G00886 [Camellia lanceoleosa]|uniref:Uncharacterized protein n=1 Tax=Camellia lanceoleosa TaxID=1840588 RepID=A0ACC0HAY0_9ERIC|nr:hypothetical protein LOK49_LG07G00886 [Camellia lanceoleosa]